MATIQLKTSFFVLAFLLYLFPAVYSLDGGPDVKVGWGTKDIPVPAGQHSITIWFPYLFVFKVGKGTANVTLAEGQTANVAYRAPWLVFLPGKVTVG